MLRNLHITNFVLIEQADLAFGRALSVFTGETGAGKSILLDALGLVLGGRLTGNVLREEGRPATITAEFDNSAAMHEMLQEAGIEPEEGIILKRIITPTGSRCLINDQPVSVALLKTLGERLVEIHGQHGQRDLTDLSRQRELLDAFSNLKITETAHAHAAWKEAQRQLAALEEAILAARREEDYLRHIAAELSALAPQPGEEAELAGTRAKLMRAEKLGGLLAEALGELQSANPAHTAQRMLLRSDAAQVAEIQAVSDTLERAQIELAEATRQLEQLAEDYGYDPARLETVEERLFALRAAARKHQCSVDALAELLAEVRAKLATLSSEEKRLKHCRKAAEETKETYLHAATKLSEKRSKASEKLAKAVMAELAALKMAATRFRVLQEALPEENWAAHGMDKLCFEVSTNTGSPFGPLHKIVSGGELSRFMLALKVVLAEEKNETTLIFDEIDAGTSGLIADAIGERLAKLGAKQQVMVITHLPQVAGKGATHFKVAKIQQKKSTATTVKLLGKKERQEELAQMLSGREVTAEARKAAAKLLAG